MKPRLMMLGAPLFFALSASAVSPDPAKALHALFDEAWAFQLREEPLFATSVGVHSYDDRLPSSRPEDLARSERFWKDVNDRLRAVDRAKLSAEDRINRDIFGAQLRDRLAEFEFRTYRLPLNADSGFHTEFADLPRSSTLLTVKDHDNYLARLRAFPAWVDQQIGQMRQGLRDGFTLPRVVLDGWEVTVARHVVDDPEKSLFFEPLRKLPSTMPTADQKRLRDEARAAVMSGAVAGYRTFLDFMTREYIPGARQTTGASDLPNGRAFYAHLVRRATTLDVTPEEVHRIGLAEVARIRREMDDVIRQSGFKGNFSEFLTFLRTDPRFYAKTPDELLKEASFIAKKMDGKLPSLFGKLPRLPYGVDPVPEHLAPKYTGGRYSGAPEGGTQAGSYWVNTYRLETRPLYTLTALTLHEAVPGHHLQIALNRELTGLPNFRRFSYIDAFGEGWGLYAEHLGLEAGLYRDPYTNFGRLTYEMWRACRLVVDTGLHAMGWSRQRALDYLAGNTALSLHEVTTETDRYISWPGQALAYKMGELKLKELRKRAEEALGERFDVRAFHDVVLGSGSIPLGVLTDKVQAYIDAEKKGPRP